MAEIIRTISTSRIPGLAISSSLLELDEKSPKEQAEFWKSVAISRSKELEDVGGLAPDEIFNDSLSRFFDSSDAGLHQVFQLCLKWQNDGKDVLSKAGFQEALAEHFQYYRTTEDGALEPDAQQSFDRLCAKVEIPISERSFSYVIRRLRLAILLNFYPMSRKAVYHMDYDESEIYTPFHGYTGKHRPVWRRGTNFTVPILQPQEPIKDLEEYFFTNKLKRQGSVHWVHLQHPKMATVLAIGQIYRMAGTVQATVRNLRHAQPQIFLSKLMDGKSQTDDVSPHQEEPLFNWNSLVYPGICLDYSSRRSLQKYHVWSKLRRELKTREKARGPPSMVVAVSEYKMGMLWTDAASNSIVTLKGASVYIGKWISDVPKQQERSCWVRLCDFLTCSGAGSCCKRRDDGYALLSQEEEEKEEMPEEDPEQLEKNKRIDEENLEELELLEEDEDECAGLECKAEDKSPVTYDGVFEKTLQALNSKNSILRAGNNEQLMTRIMVNATSEYLDVAALFEAAIERIEYLLNQPNNPDKACLIEKVEIAKLELGDILRLVEPFADHVMPELRNLKSPLDIVNFQIKKIDNNVSTFIPKCKALLRECESLCDAYDRKANQRMNHILNILTFITFVITPMQILTGVFGMNFRTMPELEHDHGYYYFWILSLALSFVAAIVLYCMTRDV